MKYLLTTVLLMLVFSIPNLAQTSPDSTITKYPHNGVVTAKYDKFKDVTTISVGLVLSETYSLETGGLMMAIVKPFEGKKPTLPPDKLLIAFISRSKNKQYESRHSWIVLADDERIKLGDGLYTNKEEGLGFSETMLFAVNLTDLKKITSAKKVEMQLGSNEYTFVEGQLKALGDFYSRIIP